MKKILTVFLLCLLLVIALLLVACNDTSNTPSTDKPGNSAGTDDSQSDIKKASEGLEYEFRLIRESGVNGYFVTQLGSCTDAEIVIPAVYNDKPVIGLGAELFRNCAYITSVTLPTSLIYIEEEAFYGCEGLTSITIPGSVTRIERLAFNYCTSLTSINIPNGVTYIGREAFGSCYELTSVTIPGSVTSMGYYVFSCCPMLESIVVDKKNTRYHSAGNCLIETATKTLILGCKTSIIPADGSVTSIGAYAFSYCDNLTSITIPESVTRIDMGAFQSSDLTSIIIPSSVTSIGKGAFGCCESLESITLPFVGDSASATSYPHYPFGYIFSDYYPAGSGFVETKQFYHSSKNESKLLTSYIPATLKSVTITGGEIWFGAFYGCENLTSITIGNGVTNIEDDAFHGCTGLAGITISDSVTRIGISAFYGCTGLAGITIPNSVTSIGSSAFSGCTSLTGITIPNSVTSIGGSAFSGCTGLVSVKIPNSVTSIENFTFSGCTSLTSITIPNSVKSIGLGAFSDCTNLTSITFQGTKAQWKQAANSYVCNSNTGDYTIHCTDGDITK